MPYHETSALDGHNINHVFNKLAQNVLKEAIATAIEESKLPSKSV